MKLQSEFKNFLPALKILIGDMNPVIGSDNANSICYFLGLKSSRKGFDYYELIRDHNSKKVFFRIYTMNGLSQIAETKSRLIEEDLEVFDWHDLLLEITMLHFSNEEYKALKMGYVKTSGKGCLLLVTIFISLNVVFYNLW